MAIKFRVKCPQCGKAVNTDTNTTCAKCGAELRVDQPAMLQLYRMGNFMGAAGGFEIYINGVSYGQIGNKESLRFPLP